MLKLFAFSILSLSLSLSQQSAYYFRLTREGKQKGLLNSTFCSFIPCFYLVVFKEKIPENDCAFFFHLQMLLLSDRLIILALFIEIVVCQQSSVQIQKIEADPPNPNVGEGLKIRCFLINVDPFAQYPTQLLWSIRRYSTYS